VLERFCSNDPLHIGIDSEHVIVYYFFIFVAAIKYEICYNANVFSIFTVYACTLDLFDVGLPSCVHTLIFFIMYSIVSSTLSQLRELLDSGTVSLTYTLPPQLFTMLNTLIFLNDEVKWFNRVKYDQCSWSLQYILSVLVRIVLCQYCVKPI
jgi:hypothetical protein